MKPTGKRSYSRQALASFFIAALSAGNPLLTGADSASDMVFNWAFVRQAPDSEFQTIESSGAARIEQGDEFKIFVQPLQNAYIYVLLHSAQNELLLLFPGSFDDLDDSNYSAREYYFPEGEDWFMVDGSKGMERFLLLASSERLFKLEELVKSYLDMKKKAKDSEERIHLAQQRVLEEIARLRLHHSKFVATAEKPITIAGGVRGDKRALKGLAIEIRAQRFYSKIFRLEH